MKKPRLTKKRLAALDIALSFDDVLYEKYRRLHDELQREWGKLYKASRVVKVLKRRGDNFEVMKIVDVTVASCGTEVVVE